MTTMSMTEPRRSALRTFRNLFRRKYAKIIIGGAIVLILGLASAFAPVLAPRNPMAQDVRAKLKPPTYVSAAPLGTDFLGRDVLSRIIYGSRVSLIVGVVSVALAALIGTALGAIAGFYGGVIDEIIGKVVEIFLAFPFLLLAIVIMAFLGPGLGNVIVALVLSRWVHFCRLVRGEVMTLKSRDHVTAARALGAGDAYLIARHILPGALSTILVMGTFAMALVIIYESSLSFLGLGVSPSTPTWGAMLSESRNYMHSAPWIAIFPGLAIFITVLGINLLGDGLRDILDPRLRAM